MHGLRSIKGPVSNVYDIFVLCLLSACVNLGVLLQPTLRKKLLLVFSWMLLLADVFEHLLLWN